MLKFKPQNPYWTEFASYQSFENVDDMLEQIKIFERTYELPNSVKAVLNTIKLHAKKTFIGVCWLYREEIAKKAKVSLASVKRAIKLLKESGILKVYPHIHTKRGGQTHNVYVIEPIFTIEQSENVVTKGTETASEPANEPPYEDRKEPSNPVPASDSKSESQPHRNSHTNSNTRSKDISIKIDDTSVSNSDILKSVPSEFIKIMKPYYANKPEVIRARWKTVCVAVKKTCLSFENTTWDTIEFCWKKTVSNYKRKRIKNRTDDGLGGYFYGVLQDWLFGDMLRYGLSRG